MTTKKELNKTNVPDHWQRNLWFFLGSQFFSGLTSFTVQYALIWYLTFQTGSATVISMATLVGMLPTVLLSPFIGPLVDRLPRKMMLILPDAIVALFALFLFAFGAVNGSLTIPIIFIAMFFRSVAQTFQFPTVQSILPTIVPPEEITKANGKSSLIQSANTILSPALGAGLILFMPIEHMVLLDVLGAIIAILIIVFVVKIPKLKHALTGKIQIMKETADGLKTLVKNRGIFYFSLLNTIISLLFLPAISLYPLMTMGYFGGDMVQVGAIEVIWSFGMMLGGAIIGMKGAGKNRMLTIFIAAVVLSLTMGISGLLPGNFTGFIVFSVLNLFTGVAMSFINAPFMAMVQESFPPEKLGRVFGVMNSLTSLAGPVGLIFAGPLADHIGVEKMFIIAGVGVLICLAVSWSIPVIRRYDINLRAKSNKKS